MKLNVGGFIAWELADLKVLCNVFLAYDSGCEITSKGEPLLF